MNYPYYQADFNPAGWNSHYRQPMYRDGILYPFSLSPYDSIIDMEKDISYTKQIYPKAVKKIQAEIEEECDKLEYKGSYMFDDTPDRLRLAAMTDRIYERVSAMDLSIQSLSAKSFDATPGKGKINPAICHGEDCMTPPQRPCHGRDCPPPRPPRPCHGRDCPPPPPPRPPKPCHGRDCRPPRPDYRPDGKPDWLRNLIEIMLYNEMNYRRNRYREHNRWL